MEGGSLARIPHASFSVEVVWGGSEDHHLLHHLHILDSFISFLFAVAQYTASFPVCSKSATDDNITLSQLLSSVRNLFSLSEDKPLLVKLNPTITQGNVIKMLVYTLLL